MTPTAKTSRARITVVESVYHSGPDGQPTCVQSQYQRRLDSDEQAYRRTATAGEEWKPLEVGWLASSGMMVLQNVQEPLQAVPTPEVEAELAARVLLVSFDEDDPHVHALVLPGESMRLHPADVQFIRVRCRRGAAKYTVTLFPG